MSKKIYILIILSFFGISYQLKCSDFFDDTCGGHNEEYNLKCRKFSLQSTCIEVEYDKGCNITSQRICEKTDSTATGYECFFSASYNNKCERINVDTGCKINRQTYECLKDSVQDDEDCFYSKDGKTCQKVKKSCELYQEKECGGLEGIKNNKQCIQMNNYCEEITLDEFCQIDKTNKRCVPRSGANINTVKEECRMNKEGTECKKHIKECSEYSTNNCKNYGENCILVQKTYVATCQLATIDSKCEIDSSGICKDKTDANLNDYQKCAYNSDYSKCEVTNKDCSEIKDLSKCAGYSLSPNGFKCSKVEGLTTNCKDVQIDDSCKINESGQCTIITAKDKNECRYDEFKTKCILYQVNTNCKLNGVLCEDDGLEDQNQICDFTNEEKTICRPRTKKCKDYKEDSSCEAVKSGNNKCSWFSNSECREYTIDSYCTVTSGKCKPVSNTAIDSNNQECLFDIPQSSQNSCKVKSKECQNYYENCEDHNKENEIQCVRYLSGGYCTPIKIDQYCHVSSSNLCTNKVTIDNKKICAFDDSISPTLCQIRDKKCKDYYPSKTDCNSVSNCAYKDQHCYEIETDNNCVLNNGNCNTKTDVTLSKDEKCDFVENNENDEKYFCKKRNKYCQEYDDSQTCNAAPKTDEEQCYYFSSCQTIELDGNCFVNSEGNCVENGSGKLASNEGCYFYDSKTRCAKREKLCTDYTDSACGNYSPEMKLCFNIDSKGCKEVKIDPQCSIDENNECKGDSCHFDDNNDKCYYQKNESQFLKLKRFILFALLLAL